MNWDYRLRNLPSAVKGMLASFILVMLFGYSASFILLKDTTQLKPQGIEENYNGNEDDEAASGPLKFKKSKYEMMSTIHSHAFTLAVLFLLLGFMIYFTGMSPLVKKALMIEPLISIVITFGSLLLLWQGVQGFKYLALASGIIMHASFVLMQLILVRELYFVKK